MSTIAPDCEPRIIIVGAGMSGILVGIRLLQTGITNFVIFEKESELGGTWRDNRYPGLSCDVPSHHYVYTFEPNPEWSSVFAGGPEIRDYFERAAHRYGVAEHIQFNTEVVSAAFSETGWTVGCSDGSVEHATIFICATGVLHHPVYPDIAGAGDFLGACFHSSRWPRNVDLNDKRVGIIGTGSTAIQIVPAIVEEVAELKLFQRTAQWILPYPNRTYSAQERAEFRENPDAMQALYKKWEGQFNHTFARAVIGDEGEMKRIADRCEENLQINVRDPLLRDQLTPNYKVACKRLILSDRFYPAIQQPQAHLVTTPISHIDADAVVTADGERHELDVLVLATGFDGHRFMRDINIQGLGDESLGEIWDRKLAAYRSVAMPDFPNFFMIVGPHSPIGNFSLILIAEMQVDYIFKLIGPILKGEKSAVCPKRSATDAFNHSLQAAMKDTVWVSGCDSWYLDKDGNPVTWPWTFEQFESDMAKPRFEDFEFM